MTFEAALGIAAITLSVVALATSILFFLLSNNLFLRMNQTEARIEEIARGTAEKMSAVVDRAVDFWTRPTKEDQAAWQTELGGIVGSLREQVASPPQDNVGVADVRTSLNAIVERLERVERDMASRGTAFSGTLELGGGFAQWLKEHGPGVTLPQDE